MKKIHGYVLVKETNLGIPNLVVAAYDSDATIRDLITDHPRTNVFTSQFMDKLGTRIGSVLTESDGNFSLNREDLYFEGVESRPDLLLVVFAPEDVLDPKRPFVLPPEQRILYISSVPREDAGVEEAYVIRLLQTQLNEFRIPSGPEQTNSTRREATSNQLLDDIDKNKLSRDKIKERFGSGVKKEYDKNIAQREDAKKIMQNFSALPLAARNHPMLLKNKNDLETFQKKSVNDGLDRLKNYDGGLKLSMTWGELKTLGMKLSDGKITGKINSEKFSAKLKTMTGGVNLVRKIDFSPSAISPDILYQKYFSTPTSSAGDEKTTTNKKKKN